MRTLTIGSAEYEIERVGYRRQREAATIIGRIIAPMISGAAGDSARALSDCVSRLSDADLERLTELFAPGCRVREDGRQWVPLSDSAVRDVHFDRAGLASYAAWLRAALEENLASFFKAAPGLLAGQAAR